MIFKDYYKILGLDTNKVTPEQVKLAFREQAKKYHPDVNNGNDQYEDRFKDINEAYKVLSSAQSKRKYDRMWISHVGKRKIAYETSKREKGSAFSEFFTMFFGEDEQSKENDSNKNIKKKNPIRGENVETEIEIGLEDAFYGVDKRISLRAVDGNLKTFAVKVPAGIRSGEKIRLLGQGKKGQNGGKNGDLFIKINIKNSSKFRLDGYNLETDLYLSPWEAALGKRVNIETIDDTVAVYVPPGIQSGERVKIAQKGYKDGKGNRGDLIAEIKTVVPKNLTEEEKELFEKLKTISQFNPRNDK